MKRVMVWVAVGLCVVFCATSAVGLRMPALEVRTLDQNGDGRADLWRHFDRHGQLIEIDVDTNFDGRPDREEYYERGILVRRESDRDFNGQADLIDEFDAVTHAQTRSVIDVDFDGSADLLVLFRDGRPIFTERARPARSGATPERVANRRVAGHLVPLFNPFDSDTAVRTSAGAGADPECVALSTSGDLPPPRVLLSSFSAANPIDLARAHFRSRELDRWQSPRAPPRL